MSTLLVCSTTVRERLEAVNGRELPEWQVGLAEVTDEELKRATVIQIVVSNIVEDEARYALITRLQTMGKPAFDYEVQTIEGLETRAAKVEEDRTSAKAAERARLKAERKDLKRMDRESDEELDAERLAALRGPRIKRTVRELAAEPPPKVVMSSVLAAELNLLGGPSEAGKSLLARDWCLGVASGKGWRGYDVPEARTVLWVASEGTHDIAERWSTQPLYEDAADRVFMLDEAVNLVSKSDVDWLLDEYATERPGVVVFDVIYGMGMADDTGTRDAFPVIDSMKRISKAWGAATVALGHPPHDGSGRRFRGTSAWRQLCYVEWHLADLYLSCEKSKIDAKGKHTANYSVSYPNINWLSPVEAVADEAGRRERIREDVEDFPAEADIVRARRLGPEFGLSTERVRVLIRQVKRDLKDEGK